MFLFFPIYFPLSAYPTATLTDQEITVTPKGIEIQLHERTLGGVLAHIQQVSGIRFSFPSAMRSTPITASIHARDWPTAVRALLRPFSTAEVWDKKELSRVYVLERGTATNISEEQADSSEGGVCLRQPCATCNFFHPPQVF